MLSFEPGAPWENGFAESFFSRLRDELLNVEEFPNLAEGRVIVARPAVTVKPVILRRGRRGAGRCV